MYKFVSDAGKCFPNVLIYFSGIMSADSVSPDVYFWHNVGRLILWLMILFLRLCSSVTSTKQSKHSCAVDTAESKIASTMESHISTLKKPLRDKCNAEWKLPSACETDETLRCLQYRRVAILFNQQAIHAGLN